MLHRYENKEINTYIIIFLTQEKVLFNSSFFPELFKTKNISFFLKFLSVFHLIFCTTEVEKVSQSTLHGERVTKLC